MRGRTEGGTEGGTKGGRDGRRGRQEGFTLIEMLATAAIIAVFAVLVIPRVTGIMASNNRTVAQGEIEAFIAAAQRWRSAKGDYDDLADIDALTADGYGVRPFTDGVNENVYGLTVALAGDGGDDATLSYTFPNRAACAPVMDGLTDADGDPAREGLVAVTACTAAEPSVLVLTIE